MSITHTGGCEHVRTHSNNDPIDNYACHCPVCHDITGQDSTHVVIFRHADLTVDNPAGLIHQPFNVENPEGSLQLCTCITCGAPIMLDDKERRIRAVVPNLMGFDSEKIPPTYHAFFDPSAGKRRPDDGRPVYAGLDPEFIWPKSA